MKIEEYSTEKIKEINCDFDGIIIAKHITRADIAYVIYNELNRFENKDDFDKRLFEDRLAEAQYELHDKKFYFQMKNNILQKFNIEQMKQCFFAYENQQYYLCICGLLPLAERMVIENKENDKYNWSDLENDFKKKYSAYFHNDIENELKEYSIRMILRKLSTFVRFDKNEPDYLNRHWILHGRADRLPTKADCLRLFNIIELILDIKNEAKQNLDI